MEGENGPPLTSARLRPSHQHSKRWTKREEPQAALTGAWPLSLATVASGAPVGRQVQRIRFKERWHRASTSFI
jgi:hypothetical protein